MCISSNGRPRSITPREEARIVRSICSGKAKTATDAHRMLVADSQRVVTPQTVRNMLRRRGLIAVTRKRKPLLKASHRRQRLAFAHKYGDWTVEDWKRVIWSDETKINRLGSDGRLWRWKKRGSGLCENEVAPTVKFGGGSIMIWGCMTYQGVGFMSKIDSTMDSKLYVEILNWKLQRTIEWYCLDRDQAVFQHDNDPKHTAKRTSEWLAENKINVLDWPAQSPDLNPIEHLWFHVKNKLARGRKHRRACKSSGRRCKRCGTRWALKHAQIWSRACPDESLKSKRRKEGIQSTNDGRDGSCNGSKKSVKVWHAHSKWNMMIIK